MSRVLRLDLLLQDEAQRLMKDLSKSVATATEMRTINCFRECDGKLYVPMGYDLSWLPPEKIVPSPEYPSRVYGEAKVLYSGKLQLEQGVDPEKIKDQQEIYDEYLDKSTMAMCASTGFGKTRLSCALARAEKGKTCVLCPSIEILNMWESEFKDYGVDVGWVKNPQAGSIPDTTVILCTIETGRKLSPRQVADVKVVIYDEAHRSTITAVTETLLNFVPKKLIVATATMKREDGGHAALALYHGNNVVERVLKKNFEIIKCETGIVPDTSKKVSINGTRRIDYTHAMKSINADPRYTKIVYNFVRAVADSSDGVTIVLARDNFILDSVSEMLNKAQIRHLLGNRKINIRKQFSGEKFILAINKKGEMGLDIPGVKDVVMLYSTPSIQQPEGRAREDDFRFWFFVHDHRMHEKHWKSALVWADTRSRGEYTTRTIRLSMDYETNIELVSGKKEPKASSSNEN